MEIKLINKSFIYPIALHDFNLSRALTPKFGSSSPIKYVLFSWGWGKKKENFSCRRKIVCAAGSEFKTVPKNMGKVCLPPFHFHFHFYDHFHSHDLDWSPLKMLLTGKKGTCQFQGHDYN